MQTSWALLCLYAVALDSKKVRSCDLVSSDPSIISVIENGTIQPEEPVDPPIPPEPEPPKPIEDPYKLQVIDSKDLPPISERANNQWYYAVESRQDSNRYNDVEVEDNMGVNATADKYNVM